MLGSICLATAMAAMSVLISVPAFPATCRLSVAGLNRERFIPGWAPLGQECGWEGPFIWHSPPFGNWGADSNYGTRVDGDQFQGWHYGDGHYQWNSCTYFYPCPDSSCRYCNYPWPYCTDQKTIGAVNTHGSKYVDVWVSCPVDTDGDGDCDQGGCKDVWAYGESNNWVALYELDLGPWPWGIDDYVDTLYFPPTEVNLFCEPGYCYAAGTGWAVRTSSAFTYAEMAMVVNTGWYVDDVNCEYQRFGNPQYNCVW